MKLFGTNKNGVPQFFLEVFLWFSDIFPNSKEIVFQSSANSNEKVGVILLAGRSNKLVRPVERTKLDLIATSS